MNVIRIQGEYEKRCGVYYEYDRDSVPLGEGGMGRIYKGFRVDLRSGLRMPVAIKSVYANLHSKEILERARREASIQIDNENLMKMYGFIENQEQLPNGAWGIRYYMPMELLVGVNLDDVMRGVTANCFGVQIPFAQQLYDLINTNKVKAISIITKAILAGIMALHNKGYIHRDIDPSNVMVTIDGKIKLIDYGICKQVSSLATIDKVLTATGTFIGKVNYAAPELVIGDVRHQNVTTDIYSIGVLMYQMYTGVLPFEGADAEILASHLNKELPLKAIRNVTLRKIIAKTTEKKQIKRYQSAAEMIVDLERLETKLLNERRDPSVLFHKYHYAFYVLGVVLVVTFLGLLLKPLPHPEPTEKTMTAKDLYKYASELISSEIPDSVIKGYDCVHAIARDSLYAPAIMAHYENVIINKDTLRWNEALQMVRILADKESDLAAIYESAICFSNISPKLDLPEVERYDAFNLEKNYMKANKLFELVLSIDEGNYKAMFWSLINYISLNDPQTYGEIMTELYLRYNDVMSLHSDAITEKYKNVSEKIIETTLRNWDLI